MKYKIRLHLAKGPNYKKWQVKYNKIITYYDPENFSITMINCRLRNHRKTAEKIFAGANKTVCAWIECEEIKVLENNFFKSTIEIRYNPRIAPYWLENNKEVDDNYYQVLQTNKRKIYSALINISTCQS
jgi:hypothetical protein